MGGIAFCSVSPALGAGSSLTCAEHPARLIRHGKYLLPSNCSFEQQAWGECQSEVKGEHEGRRTRTAAIAP
jgi:hypothetical protein